MGDLNEKTLLPVEAPVQATSPDVKTKRKDTILREVRFACLVLMIGRYILLPIFVPSWRLFHIHYSDEVRSSSCEQAEPLLPKSFDVSALVEGEDKTIINWLADSVKIPTEIFDVMGPIDEDPRYDVFYKFAEYLETAFPLVHSHLTRTRVMTHALIFEWEGSDPNLKPLLLTGHQDVVPVLNATRNLWSHEPYGGEYDEKTGLIWGRGSCDDKSGTIGVLSAVELLLKSGKFQPTRTVILSFGIDEETGGKVGAYALGQWIEEKYGKDSISMLVDEGSGITESWGELFATPAVGEKGYLDVELRVETLGGHSSVPPPHTGIGYLALLIAELERHPHKPRLEVDSPLVGFLACGAASAPGMSKDLKKSVRKVENSLSSKSGKVDKKALRALQEWWVHGSVLDGTAPEGFGRAMVSTTQAIDIINGGLKVNALPESVYAVVNHRINIASSVSELQEHLVDVLSPVAAKYNLSLEAFGEDIHLHGCHLTEAKKGKVILAEAFDSHLDPAQVSPFTVDSPAWRILSGTTKGVYATRPEASLNEVEKAKEIYMAPSISTGNTDTKRYWNLTKNIYRFAYLTDKGASNAHTVDEFIHASSFIEMVRWFMVFIVNMDETREL